MAITWTTPRALAAKGACSLGTEAYPATSATPTEGLALAGNSGAIGIVDIFVESDSAMSAGQIVFLQWNPISGVWSKIVGLDGTIEGGGTAYALPALEVEPRGRIAAVPSGLGVACRVYLIGTVTGF